MQCSNDHFTTCLSVRHQPSKTPETVLFYIPQSVKITVEKDYREKKLSQVDVALKDLK